MLFQLQDEAGRVLLIAHSAAMKVADRFGFRHLDAYRGRISAIDASTAIELAETGSVPIVRILNTPVALVDIVQEPLYPSGCERAAFSAMGFSTDLVNCIGARRH